MSDVEGKAPEIKLLQRHLAFKYFAESGGLISYGNVIRDAYRQAAT
jgi:hypothetical protein